MKNSKNIIATELQLIEKKAIQLISSDLYLINIHLFDNYKLETSIILAHFISKYKYFKKMNMLIDNQWFFTDYIQQRDETGLSIMQIKKSRKELSEDNIILLSKFLGNPKKLEWFSIDFNVIIALINDLKEYRESNLFGDNPFILQNERIKNKIRHTLYDYNCKLLQTK